MTTFIFFPAGRCEIFIIYVPYNKVCVSVCTGTICEDLPTDAHSFRVKALLFGLQRSENASDGGHEHKIQRARSDPTAFPLMRPES